MNRNRYQVTGHALELEDLVEVMVEPFYVEADDEASAAFLGALDYYREANAEGVTLPERLELRPVDDPQTLRFLYVRADWHDGRGELERIAWVAERVPLAAPDHRDDAAAEAEEVQP